MLRAVAVVRLGGVANVDMDEAGEIIVPVIEPIVADVTLDPVGYGTELVGSPELGPVMRIAVSVWTVTVVVFIV